MHHPPSSREARRSLKLRVEKKPSTHLRRKSVCSKASKGSGFPSPELQMRSSERVKGLKRPAQTLIHQDISTSKWLYHGACVRNKTRNMVFKKGGEEYFSTGFVDDVKMYGCAFLNSVGGSLVVGADDDGIVCGLHASHRIEDLARRLVDCTMSMIKPALFPFNYSLSFLPVMRPGQQDHDLKVVCLTFNPPSGTLEPVLYSTERGEVFIKWDVIVQGPLDFSQIIEWYKQKFPYWMDHRSCRALSRGPPFEDHGSMMDRILDLQANKEKLSSREI